MSKAPAERAAPESSVPERTTPIAADPSATPTFHRDIAPIVHANCSVCHRPGGAGPFSLISYDDVARRARLIATVTESRYMPPWLPEPGVVKYAGERRLSDAQIALIERWAEGGAPAGDSSVASSPPSYPEGWQLGTPDLVLEMPEAFTVPAEGRDVFRNFVIPARVPALRYVRAIEFRPGNPQVVHHAEIRIDSTRSSRRADRSDPGPGFGGMEAGLSAAASPNGVFLGWTPGKFAQAEPEGIAWSIAPTDDVVLLLHLVPSGKPEPIRSSIGLYFTDTPPTRPTDLLVLESTAIDLPPGRDDLTVTDRYVLPAPIEVLSVYPHAHFLGKRIEAFATLPNGRKEWLVQITDWDFNWQDQYRFDTPVRLPAGSALEMRIRYDNRAENPRNPHDPPKRIRYGPESYDEMARVFLQVAYADPLSQERVRSAYLSHTLERGEEECRRRLEENPSDSLALHDLGVYARQRGQAADAISRFRAAIEADPENALAHYSLAHALSDAAPEEAIRAYRRANEIWGGSLDALNNIGVLLKRLGRLPEAIEVLREAVALDSDDLPSHNYLAVALRDSGQVDEALTALKAIVKRAPDDAETRLNLGITLLRARRLDAALPHLQRAATLDPRSPRPHNQLGILHASQGRHGEAKKAFERALQIDAGYGPAQKNLRRLLGG